MRDTSFQGILSDFLLDYLPRRRGCSPNTIESYRDAFVLLVRYAGAMGIAPGAIGFDTLGRRFVEGYLDWLDRERGCSAQTRNNRLAAIKSFLAYAQAVAPERIGLAEEVRSIPAAKSVAPEIAYLSLDGIEALLASAARGGRRDLAMLSLLYDTGARVQEVVDCDVGDLRLDKPRTIKLTGKGNKTRVVPVTAQVADIMRAYMSEERCGASASDPLFTNAAGNRIGRAGVAYVLRKHAARAREAGPACVPERVTPHMLRHSKAVHMLEAGVNLVHIRDFLGHASVTTTEAYARASPETRRDAVETLRSRVLPRDGVYDAREREELLNWLKRVI